jgi:transposase
MPNKNYPSDLTDSQWEHIKELLPKAKRQRRPRELEMRQVVNAIFYVVVGGIQWRMLPKDFPKWQSVYYYFRLWRKTQQWQRLHDTMRAEVRRASGRHKHPTAGCLDSQSVKTTQIPGARGFDAAKNILGRKRHLLGARSPNNSSSGWKKHCGSPWPFRRNGLSSTFARAESTASLYGGCATSLGTPSYARPLSRGLARRRSTWGECSSYTWITSCPIPSLSTTIHLP